MVIITKTQTYYHEQENTNDAAEGGYNISPSNNRKNFA